MQRQPRLVLFNRWHCDNGWNWFDLTRLFVHPVSPCFHFSANRFSSYAWIAFAELPLRLGYQRSLQALCEPRQQDHWQQLKSPLFLGTDKEPSPRIRLVFKAVYLDSDKLYSHLDCFVMQVILRSKQTKLLPSEKNLDISLCIGSNSLIRGPHIDISRPAIINNLARSSYKTAVRLAFLKILPFWTTFSRSPSLSSSSPDNTISIMQDPDDIPSPATPQQCYHRQLISTQEADVSFRFLKTAPYTFVVVLTCFFDGPTKSSNLIPK